MVAWLDGRTVLVNDYSAVSPSFRRRFRRSLEVYGIDLVELLYKPQSGCRIGIPTVVGNWMDFVRAGDVLIMPTFGLVGDRRVPAILQDLQPSRAVETINCSTLAAEGGLLHCVTWQIQKVRTKSGGGFSVMVRGRGNCTRNPDDANCITTTPCENCSGDISDGCREDAALDELVGRWHLLTRHVQGRDYGTGPGRVNLVTRVGGTMNCTRVEEPREAMDRADSEPESARLDLPKPLE